MVWLCHLQQFLDKKKSKKLEGDVLQSVRSIVTSWQQEHYEQKAENGESPIDVILRMELGMVKILLNQHEENILISMHGRSLRILLSTLLGRELCTMDTFPIPNLGLYLLDYDYETNKYSLIKEADVTHLSQDLVTGFFKYQMTVG